MQSKLETDVGSLCLFLHSLYFGIHCCVTYSVHVYSMSVLRCHFVGCDDWKHTQCCSGYSNKNEAKETYLYWIWWPSVGYVLNQLACIVDHIIYTPHHIIFYFWIYLSVIQMNKHTYYCSSSAVSVCHLFFNKWKCNVFTAGARLLTNSDVVVVIATQTVHASG